MPLVPITATSRRNSSRCATSSAAWRWAPARKPSRSAAGRAPGTSSARALAYNNPTTPSLVAHSRNAEVSIAGGQCGNPPRERNAAATVRNDASPEGRGAGVAEDAEIMDKMESSMRDTVLFHALLDEALAAGTVVRFRAEGTSMHPTIRDGEVITIAPVSSDEVVPGDVLLCRHKARMLAHRLVAVTTRGDERKFHCRGDAKSGYDAPVGAEAVVGRIISVCRDGRAAPLCGLRARLRHTARSFASRARLFRSIIRRLPLRAR